MLLLTLTGCKSIVDLTCESAVTREGAVNRVQLQAAAPAPQQSDAQSDDAQSDAQLRCADAQMSDAQLVADVRAFMLANKLGQVQVGRGIVSTTVGRDCTNANLAYSHCSKSPPMEKPA